MRLQTLSSRHAIDVVLDVVALLVPLEVKVDEVVCWPSVPLKHVSDMLAPVLIVFLFMAAGGWDPISSWPEVVLDELKRLLWGLPGHL